jgi:thiosulfate dehydrogenase [quinone] large subunit
MFGWFTLLLLGAGRFSLDEWRKQPRQLAPDQVIADQGRRRFLTQAGAAVGAVAALLIAGGEVFSGFASRSQTTAAATATIPKAGATNAPAASSNTANAANPTSVASSPLARAATPPAAAPTDTPVPAGPANPPDPTAAPASGTLIASINDVPVGGGLRFTTPDTGSDAYLVHLPDGRFNAFSAICTHAGCTVNYDSQNTIFSCPCHGAEFDPANNGAVLRRPARAPLPRLNINVDQSSGNIYFVSS